MLVTNIKSVLSKKNIQSLYSSARQIFNQSSYHQSSGYRVVLLLGKMRPQYSYPHTKVPNIHSPRFKYSYKLYVTRFPFYLEIKRCLNPFQFQKSATPIMGFIGLAIALPPPSVHEVSPFKFK